VLPCQTVSDLTLSVKGYENFHILNDEPTALHYIESLPKEFHPKIERYLNFLFRKAGQDLPIEGLVFTADALHRGKNLAIQHMMSIYREISKQTLLSVFPDYVRRIVDEDVRELFDSILDTPEGFLYGTTEDFDQILSDPKAYRRINVYNNLEQFSAILQVVNSNVMNLDINDLIPTVPIKSDRVLEFEALMLAVPTLPQPLFPILEIPFPVEGDKKLEVSFTNDKFIEIYEEKSSYNPLPGGEGNSFLPEVPDKSEAVLFFEKTMNLIPTIKRSYADVLRRSLRKPFRKTHFRNDSEFFYKLRHVERKSRSKSV